MFSIVIPLYNKAPYIEKAIRSVMCQTYTGFELIVVNDGSTDKSLENLRFTIHDLQLSEEKIRVLEQENQGVSVARNNGVKFAKYNYIAFLDADDWWAPTYLEEMKGLIEEFPEAGIYGSSYFIAKNSSQRLVRIGVESTFKKGYINYFKVYSNTGEMPLWTGATVVRKDIYVYEEGFKPDLKLGEDFDLWLRVSLKYPVVLLNKPLAYYNQDVDETERSVVHNKLYKPESHFVFNLDFVEKVEAENKDLKDLLDLLRVYTLERYRLQKAYTELVSKEISKVDFSRQPFKFWCVYHLPVWMVNQFLRTKLKAFSLIRNVVSLIKT